MRFFFLIPFCAAVAASPPAWADNSKCYSLTGDDKSRPEITCKPFTERLLVGLRNSTPDQIVKVMNAPGKPIQGGTHYLSNARTYSGDLNVTFRDGRASIVSAIVQPSDDSDKQVEFIWNADLGGCSDFPNSRKRCNDE